MDGHPGSVRDDRSAVKTRQTRRGSGVAVSGVRWRLDTGRMFVATRIKPQARVYAESRDIECVEIDLDELRTHDDPKLKLF